MDTERSVIALETAILNFRKKLFIKARNQRNNNILKTQNSQIKNTEKAPEKKKNANIK